MNLRDLVRKIAESVSDAGVEAAGAFVCGRLWPVFRPVVLPLVAKFVEAKLAPDPDRAFQESLAELEKQDSQARAVVDALSSMLNGLSDQQFELLRGQAEILDILNAATLARRRPLYWQLLAAWTFAEQWFRARNNPKDESNTRGFRSVCAQVGLSSSAIEHLEFQLYRNSDTRFAVVDMIATLECGAHPFVAAVAYSGSLLQQDVAATINTWGKYGLAETVRPYLEGIAAAESPASRQSAIEGLAAALMLEG